MRIEDEIKQAKFKSEFEKLAINLAFTHAHFENQFAQAVKTMNTTPEQYNVLRILKGQHPKPISVKDIQSRMISKMSNTSRLIDKLKDKGFVKRVECEHDRRAVDINLTPEGIEHLDLLSKTIEPMQRGYQALSETEAKQVNELLDKLRS